MRRLPDCPSRRSPVLLSRRHIARVPPGGLPMIRRLAVLSLVFSLTSVALAQPPGAPAAPRFKWQQGQTLTYRVIQQTVVQETVLDEKTEKPVTSEARTSLTLVRKWTVKDVDKNGVATLEMS